MTATEVARPVAGVSRLWRPAGVWQLSPQQIQAVAKFAEGVMPAFQGR